MKRLLSTKVAVACQPCATDILCVKEVTSRSGKKGLQFTSDVTVLFNQERLNKLSSTYIDELIRNVKSAPASPFKDLKDSDIKETIKSRYIQSPADIYNLQRQIMNEQEDFIKETKQRLAKESFKKNYQPKEK